MNRALILATAASLLLPSLSLAQQQDQHGQGRQEQHGGPPPSAPQGHPGGPGGGPGGGPPQHYVPPPHPVSPPHPVAAPPHPVAPPPHPVQAGPPHPMPGRPPMAGRPMGQPLPPRGNQFWHRGEYFARVHGPAYAYPRGWGYRRWWIGSRLPAVLLAPAFLFAGWAALNLEAPPPGYAWVRYGPDLLEVNLATGQVVDAVYGVFY